MFLHSIRWRFQLWLAFLLICILTGFGMTAFQLHRDNQFNRIDDELERRVAALSRDLRRRPPSGGLFRRPPSMEDRAAEPEVLEPNSLEGAAGTPLEFRLGPRRIRLSEATLGLFLESGASDYYFAIWSRDQELALQSTNAPIQSMPPQNLGASAETYLVTRNHYREAYYVNSLKECVLVGLPLTKELQAMHSFAWWLVAGGGAVLALGLGGGWWLVGRALKPVRDISAAAANISVGHLSQRINLAQTDGELGHLAGVLNSTFARLEAAFAEQKQFTADASHELRTPLAVLISEAQTTLARERSAAEYRDTIVACLEAAQQMRQLTESLLELARFDAGQEPMRRDPLDLAEAVRLGVERVEPLARGRGIRFLCDLTPATVRGDTGRLHQVITNLLSNAIHYNKPEGEVRVSTRCENGTVQLTVADTGVGVDAQDLPNLFKRFYRADKARAEGGSGLGLAITKAIVDAHGGSIDVQSRKGAGSTFTVRLPA